jgi:hypothetical protein
MSLKQYQAFARSMTVARVWRLRRRYATPVAPLMWS